MHFSDQCLVVWDNNEFAQCLLDLLGKMGQNAHVDSNAYAFYIGIGIWYPYGLGNKVLLPQVFQSVGLPINRHLKETHLRACFCYWFKYFVQFSVSRYIIWPNIFLELNAVQLFVCKVKSERWIFRLEIIMCICLKSTHRRSNWCLYGAKTSML